MPFLTLGIGVDNMFMLLHNYHDVVAMSSRNEMGVLLRETGEYGRGITVSINGFKKRAWSNCST